MTDTSKHVHTVQLVADGAAGRVVRPVGAFAIDGGIVIVETAPQTCPPCNGNCVQGDACPHREVRPPHGTGILLAALIGVVLGTLIVIAWRSLA